MLDMNQKTSRIGRWFNLAFSYLTTKKEMIFKYIKEGEGPWGRPLPGSLFSIIAEHVKAAGEGPISAIPNEKTKDLPVQDKKALEALKAELEPKGLYPE
mmetsp:Transcript_473/g.510  ORF Transcript_473/g.510 Transcript_473/m.510 type:complete len:99 (+) Transcript_473:401-697(+)